MTTPAPLGSLRTTPLLASAALRMFSEPPFVVTVAEAPSGVCEEFAGLLLVGGLLCEGREPAERRKLALT